MPLGSADVGEEHGLDWLVDGCGEVRGLAATAAVVLARSGRENAPIARSTDKPITRAPRMCGLQSLAPTPTVQAARAGNVWRTARDPSCSATRLVAPCYPLRAWLPPRGSGRCLLAHLSTSTRCQTGPAASLANGSGKSGRLTYLATERSGTFKNLTISAKPSRSPGRIGDEPRTSQDTWRHCCHEARSRGTLPPTSTLPLV